jgi:high-affinity iron transporter
MIFGGGSNVIIAIMFPSFIVTFREVIEAALVVAMISGIFLKLKEKRKLFFVWVGAIFAIVVSLVLVYLGSYIGVAFASYYQGKNEELLEGIFAIVTAVFVTWAIVALDTEFRRYKLKLIEKINVQIMTGHIVGIFTLAFTSVFREGVEIILLLSSISLSSKPEEVMTGFALGLLSGLFVGVSFFTASFRLPVRYVFRATTVLLIFFAGGLFAKGVHELAEFGFFAEIFKIQIPFVPIRETIAGSLMYGIFGIRNVMSLLQLCVYALYVYTMLRLIGIFSDFSDNK